MDITSDPLPLLLLGVHQSLEQAPAVVIERRSRSRLPSASRLAVTNSVTSIPNDTVPITSPRTTLRLFCHRMKRSSPDFVTIGLA